MITYYVFAALGFLAAIGLIAVVITDLRESRHWERQRTINEENQ